MAKGYGHPRIMRCIYCGTADKPLEREHILPEGLFGNATRPKASCRDCAEITSGIEREVLRGDFGTVREHLREIGMPARKKRTKKRDGRRESTELLVVRHSDGTATKFEVPSKNLPPVTIAPHLPQPRILEGLLPPTRTLNFRSIPLSLKFRVKPKSAAEFESEMRSFCNRYLSQPGDEVFFPRRILPFLRFLAKVGHCVAVSQVNIDDFEALLPEIILWKSPSASENLCQLIGGGDAFPRVMQPTKTHKLFQLAVGTREVQGQTYLVVALSLFGSGGMPTYYAVAGRCDSGLRLRNGSPVRDVASLVKG